MAMPTIPTIEQIKARIVSDLETAFNQSTPAILKSFNRVLAGALSGLIVLLYQSILWVYAQIFPDRADEAALILLGKLVGITRRAAVKAVIVADVAGTNGETVPTGVRFSAGTSIYAVTTGGTIAGGVASCTLTALLAGDAGNVADGVALAIVSANPVLTGVATVTGTTTTGADQESIDQYRARVVVRYKKRLTGGSPADYELWGLETPHFTWVSPYTDPLRPGTVVVYGKVDNQTDGIATGGQLLELESYLTADPDTGKRYRKPTTDELDLQPISRYAFNIAIQIKDGTPQLKAAILNAITEYIDSRAPYNEGVSIDRVDAITNAGVSAVATELADNDGATILQVTIREVLTTTIITNYILYGGEFAKLNDLTWTDIP